MRANFLGAFLTTTPFTTFTGRRLPLTYTHDCTMNRTGGDDLDDDFVPDDLVALSDAEDEEAGHSADGEDVEALLSADEGSPQPSTSDLAAAEKKRKRRAKEKERKAKVCNSSQ